MSSQSEIAEIKNALKQVGANVVSALEQIERLQSQAIANLQTGALTPILSCSVFSDPSTFNGHGINDGHIHGRSSFWN